jgi:hypothetical protein
MQSLANIIRVGKSRRLRGAGYMTCVGINAHKIVVGKLKEAVHLEETRVDGL